MMKNNSFVALILTHGRPDNVHTVKTLRKCGYTGDIIIVLDNEDPKIDRYRKNYENIYVFDKKEIHQKQMRVITSMIVELLFMREMLLLK